MWKEWGGRGLDSIDSSVSEKAEQSGCMRVEGRDHRMKVTSVIVLVLVSAVGGCSTSRGPQQYRASPPVQGVSDDPAAHINLGYALQNKGDLDGAIREYRQALSLNPNLTVAAVAHNNLGNALQDKGDFDGAIREYRQTLSLNPNLTVAAAAHKTLGTALHKKGDLDGAIQEYRQALSLDPNDYAFHSNLGFALAGKGDLDGAIQEYRQALSLNPNFALAHMLLGDALQRKGDLDGAIREYRQALSLNPNDNPENATTHDALGNALAQKGDLDGATQEYQTCIRIMRPAGQGVLEKTCKYALKTETAPHASGSNESRLEELKRLHDRGLLTDKEYEEKRRQILKSL